MVRNKAKVLIEH